MADWYGSGGGVVARSRRGKSVRDEEFQEEDMWGVDEEEGGEDLSPKQTFGSSSFASSAWHLPGAPKVSSSSKGKKKKKGEGKTAPQKQSSASINIPDWSKSYKKKGGSSLYADDEDAGGGDVYDDDGEDGDNSTLPPHEYIARRLARTQISSYSMCEGVGRTLKGRDLSKVRDAILTKTGFLE